MKIVDVQTRYYRVPIRHQAEDARHGLMETVELITVAVTPDDGPRGTGYAYTIGQGGRAVRSLIDHDLKPLLLGKDPRETGTLWDEMWWHLHWVGRGGAAAFAIAAVDIALWDIKAKAAQQPLYRFLGGTPGPVPAYGSGVDLGLSPEQLVDQVHGFVAEGFKAIKVKVGRDDFREDLKRIEALRANFPSGLEIMVDANMKWSPKEAIRNGKALAQYQVAWLEEPAIPEDVEGHAAIARALEVPVAVGENLHSKYEFARYLQAGAADIVQIDVVTVGGVTEWLKVARMAEAANLPVSTHYAQEVHVHLLASAPNGWYLERHAYSLDPYLIAPLEFRDGCAVPPDRPGHGLEFDEEALAPYAEG